MCTIRLCRSSACHQDIGLLRAGPARHHSPNSMIRLLIVSALTVAATAQSQQQGDVRLVNGSVPYQGTLQVWNAGEWRYVCDDGFGVTTSTVVCRQLGYWPPTPDHPVCCQPITDPPGYWLDNVQCAGTEARISQCRHRGWGNHNCNLQEGVMVRCFFRDPCVSNPCQAGAPCVRIDNIRYRCDIINERPSPPSYRVSLQGIFQTEDRSVITAECTAAYGRSMELKAFTQLERINERIQGSVLCRGTVGFEFVVVGSSVNTAQNRGTVVLDFIMVGRGESRYAEYFSCATDVSAFLQNFRNWELPMLPTPPGCAPVQFFSQNFRESGKDWFC